MDNTYVVTVFNTTTAQYEEVTLTETVYNELRRSQWRIEKNDSKHSANETPFSALIGGEEGAYENFHEFVSEKDTLVEALCKRELIGYLHKAIDQLPAGEKLVIKLFYFQHYSSQEIGQMLGISEQAVTKRRRSAYKHLRDFLKEF